MRRVRQWWRILIWGYRLKPQEAQDLMSLMSHFEFGELTGTIESVLSLESKFRAVGVLEGAGYKRREAWRWVDSWK